MSYLKYIKSGMLILAAAALLTTSTICADKAQAQPAKTVTKPAVQQQQYVAPIKTTPLTVVANPKNYLNKSIIMIAKFDKFSTLGLDYKPAFKSSEDYISFLVKRDDTTFNIPLSEMKLFLKRDTAEKFIDLKTDDEIEIKGKLFSDALGDAWIDVTELKILQKAPETKEDK
jgi:hypothetical protein